MAKVLRRVALLHRFHNSANKNVSYTIDFEVKVPSSDSVLSSLRTTGVPRHTHVRLAYGAVYGRAGCHALPSEACREKVRHLCVLLLLLNGV